MVIRSVTISHLRSHVHTTLECAPDVTIVYGPNGSGKTSLLEAISLCSLGRTFVPVPDLSLIQRGADHAMAAVHALSDHEVPYRAAVELRAGTRKRITTTHHSSASVRDLIGELPTVALSPDHKAITSGGPSERRAFVDAVMAQTSRSVTDLLFEHRRVLKQRNAVLSSHSDVADRHIARATWTQPFVEASADVIQRRGRFIEELAPLVREEYQAVAGTSEAVDIAYRPDHVDLNAGDVMQQLERTADRLEVAEWAQGTSLFGPQKDDVELTLNGRLVRETASQGQHKTLLIALKLAECRILEQRRRERPVVLLDDVFAELDRMRSNRVLDRIRELQMQCIVTTTEDDRFRAMRLGSNSGLIHVDQGAIVSTTVATIHTLSQREAS